MGEEEVIDAIVKFLRVDFPDKPNNELKDFATKAFRVVDEELKAEDGDLTKVPIERIREKIFEIGKESYEVIDKTEIHKKSKYGKVEEHIEAVEKIKKLRQSPFDVFGILEASRDVDMMSRYAHHLDILLQYQLKLMGTGIQLSPEEHVEEVRLIRDVLLPQRPYPETELHWRALESVIRGLFGAPYQQYREDRKSEANSKTLVFLTSLLHNLAAEESQRPLKWLDVGCGYGRALAVFKDLSGTNVEYYGIDTSSECVKIAEKNAREYDVNSEIEEMDAAYMRFNEEFDLISAILLLHEVDPLCLPYVIKNMIRALKSEGTIIISDFEVPYEEEKGVVAWSHSDIEFLLSMICRKAKVRSRIIPSRGYPNELSFYASYVKKCDIDDTKFTRFMENYDEFLERKKDDSRKMKDDLSNDIKRRVQQVIGRSNIDIEEILDDEWDTIRNTIKEDYAIKAHKILLLMEQIDFLDRKIEEFKNGKRCAGVV